jgi:quinol monooxygenase YgiN
MQGGNVIVNTTRITVRPENRKELCQTMASLLELVRHEQGCLNYRFYQEEADPNSFIIVGEWKSQEDWDHYLETEDFAILLGTISVLSSRADTDFKLLVPAGGPERIARMRMQ